MKDIKTKVIEVKENGDTIELTLLEHEGGLFSTNGRMKIVCDKQATIDLLRAMGGGNKKGGNFAHGASGLLKDTTVELIFHPK